MYAIEIISNTFPSRELSNISHRMDSNPGSVYSSDSRKWHACFPYHIYVCSTLYLDRDINDAYWYMLSEWSKMSKYICTKAPESMWWPFVSVSPALCGNIKSDDWTDLMDRQIDWSGVRSNWDAKQNEKTLFFSYCKTSPTILTTRFLRACHKGAYVISFRYVSERASNVIYWNVTYWQCSDERTM